MNSHAITSKSPLADKTLARGFTIIELLVVVAIIAVLISVLIAAVGPLREKTRAAATRSRMGSIATGLDQYKIDFGYFPPSTPTTFKSGASVNSGSAMLTEAMLGYLTGFDDGAGTGIANPDPNEFGFRVHANGNNPTGRVFGPYTDANASVKLAAGIYGTIRVNSPTRMVYLDGYGSEILYYRAVDRTTLGPATTIFGPPATSIFVNNDNWNSANVQFDPAGTATTGFFKTISNGGVSNSDKPTQVFGRDQYILIAPHRDTNYFTDDDVVGPQR